MSKSLSTSAQRVQDLLREKGFDCTVVELADSTRTAQEAAQAIGCTVAQIVKSLVFKTQQKQEPILVVASGSNRVNEQRLAELVGEPIGKANANFVRQHTGYVIGGVAPIGENEHIRTFIDTDLLQYETIWAAAGTPFAVFQLTPQDLQAMTGGSIATIV
jgi:Cys-tRNA(Pro) deacylase